MFTKLSFLNANRSVWLWATISSIVIVLWFLYTLEPRLLREVMNRISPLILGLSLFLLTVNGLLDALWLQLITRPVHRYTGPMRVIAWHMLGSSLLPARIGELAFIYFIHRWLEVPAARALFITLYHRLQDFIVINLFLLMTIIAIGFDTRSIQLVPVASAMLVVLVLMVLHLEYSLTLCALCLRRIHRQMGYRFLHTLLSHLLQVRIWYRHSLKPAQLWLSFLVIVLRWAVVLPAIGLLLHGSVEALNWSHSLFVTNLYLYMGIIPVQAVGGFGAGEAGLIWVLTLYGLSIGSASALSLLIRLLINLVHVSIWLFTVTILFFVVPPAIKT